MLSWHAEENPKIMKNFADIIFDNPTIVPDALAIVDRERRTTFQQLRRRVLAVAGFLLNAGIGKGERVAVMMGNCGEFVEIYLACAASGVVLVPLNTRQALVEQEVVLRDAEPLALFISTSFLDRAEALRTLLKAPSCVIVVGNSEREPLAYEQICVSGQESALPSVKFEDPALILYTSGTTSTPKGAVLSHGNLLSNVKQYQATVRLPPNSINLQLSPMYHAANIFCFVHMLIGGRTVFASKVDTDTIFELVAAEKATFMFTVPTVLYSLLDYPERIKSNLSSLENIQFGAAPITGARLDQAIQVFGPRLLHSYGMTESTSHISILGRADHSSHPGSVGKPLVGVEVRIVDDEERSCGTDQIGEILVRGDNVFCGYWRRPEETAKSLKNGWLHTGDLARRDEQGYLYMVDRKRDMIISGGTNIYPSDIELALLRHDAVAEAAVFGIPHPVWGEAVAAAVVLKGGRTVSAQELGVHLRSLLGGYKIPKIIRAMDALPKNVSGKILKNALRTMAEFET